MVKIICVLTILLTFASANAQEASKDQDSSPEFDRVSGAEIIIRFHKFIANDQQRLIQMKNRSTLLVLQIEDLTVQFNKLDTQQEADMDEGGSPAADGSLERRWDRVRSLLNLNLRSRQAVEQQIIIVQNKIEKQKGVVHYITIGKAIINGDSLSQISIPIDTALRAQVISETQNRKEQEAFKVLQQMEAELGLARQNLLLVDQLIRLNKEDLELTKALMAASVGLLALFDNQPQVVSTKQEGLEARKRVSQDTALISSLKARIVSLEKFRKPVVEAVTEFEKKAEGARSQMQFLQSAMAPHRIAYWMRFNLPKIAGIISVFFLIWLVARWIVKLVLNRMIKSKADAEGAERLETLKLASGSIITIIIIFVGFLVLLSEIGVDLSVVIGGAAVISLVIAFGAQSVVKDFFSGFMILLENQYRAGNVVRINKTTGMVENMSLRITVLRDMEGITHFIPHGQIVEVSNLTHGWSRVVFDIGVSYNENVDEVMKVLIELGAEMKEDNEYGKLLIGDMEMCGVDKFADSSVVIKFLMKTRPLKQWIVKREMLRRIKNRFDELGIEIPYPQLMVYYRDSEKSSENFAYVSEEV